MRISNERHAARLRVSELEVAIMKATDQICAANDYTVTYSELHLAMANVQARWANAQLAEETPRE